MADYGAAVYGVSTYGSVDTARGPAPTLISGYGHVEVSWPATVNAGMYQVKRRPSGSGSYSVIETLPGLSYIDIGVTNGVAYDYVITPKVLTGGVYLVGTDSDPATVTPTATVPNEASLSVVNNLIASNPAGSTIDVPDGLYRVTDANQLQLNKAITLRSNSRLAWFLGSQDWGTGRQAGNTWASVSTYWRSSLTAAALAPNDSGADITDSLTATTYQEVVGWTANGVATRFTVVAAGSTPSTGQWCYESSGDHRIRLGTNPGTFLRIEVTASTRWATCTANNVHLTGLTFRHISSAAQEDPIGNNDHTGFEMRNCVVGDTHGCALNLGASSLSTIQNFVVDSNLFQWCRGTGISGWQMNTGQVTNNRFVQNGVNSGYQWRWQGGDSKMAACWNYSWNYNLSVDGSRGVSIWADGIYAGGSNRGATHVGNKVGGMIEGPAVNWEISEGPATFNSNCFYDCASGGGGPTFQLSTSGQATVTNNLIRGFSGGSDTARVFQLTDDRRSSGGGRDDGPSVVGQHHMSNNMLIKQANGAQNEAIWSNDTIQSQGNTWSANKWHITGTGLWIWGESPPHVGVTASTVAGFNALTGGSDTAASDAERDAQLMFWGLITDTTSGGGGVTITPTDAYGSLIYTAASHYWRLGNADTVSSAADVKGANPGTPSFVTQQQPSLLIDGSDSATVFHGTNSQVVVPYSSALNLGDTFSVEMLIARGRTFVSGSGDYEVFWAKGVGGLVLGFADDNTIFANVWGGDTLATSSIGISDLNPHHIVVTKTAGATLGNTHIYIDGVDRTTNVIGGTFSDAVDSIYFGSDTLNNGGWFLGTLDEISILGGTAYSSGTVLTHYRTARVVLAQTGSAAPAATARATAAGGVRASAALSAHATASGVSAGSVIASAALRAFASLNISPPAVTPDTGVVVVPDVPVSTSPLRVEVLDKNLVRLGMVDDYKRLSAVVTFNQAGHWELEISALSAQVANLTTPGNSILVLRELDGEVEYSGTIEEAAEEYSQDEHTWRIRGRDDTGLLGDRVALPDITEQFNGTSYEEAIIQDTPIGYWRLGELEGEPLMADSSGNVNGGWYYGSATHGVDGAVRGDSGGVQYAANPAGYAVLPLDTLPRQLTIEVWVKFTLGGAAPVLSNRNSASSYGAFYFGQVGGHAYLAFHNGAVTVEVIGNRLINDNQWHHVVWTGDQTSQRLYVDGQQDAVVAAVWQPFYLGRAAIVSTAVAMLGVGNVQGGANVGLGVVPTPTLTGAGLVAPSPPSMTVQGPTLVAHGDVGASLHRLYLGWDSPNQVRWVGGIDELAIYPTALPAERIQAHYDARLNTGYDVRGGTVEAVMRGYVDGNAGSTALVRRRLAGLQLDTYNGLGDLVVEQARFANLLELLRDLAVKGADAQGIPLGFRLQFSLSPLTFAKRLFTVYRPRDLTDRVVYAPSLNNLVRYSRVAPKAPSANFVYLGGKGVLTGRVIVSAEDDDSITSWGRREVFKARVDTADTNILAETASQELAQQASKETVEMEPLPMPGLIYGRDYGLGDTVSFITKGGTLINQVVYEVEIQDSKEDGLRFIPKVGPPSVLDPDSTSNILTSIDQRIANLETT